MGRRETVAASGCITHTLGAAAQAAKARVSDPGPPVEDNNGLSSRAGAEQASNTVARDAGLTGEPAVSANSCVTSLSVAQGRGSCRPRRPARPLSLRGCNDCASLGGESPRENADGCLPLYLSPMDQGRSHLFTSPLVGESLPPTRSGVGSRSDPGEGAALNETTPSPGSQLTLLADLSHQGGEVREVSAPLGRNDNHKVFSSINTPERKKWHD